MKKKVLFVYDNLLHYRKSLFNLLGEHYDFTVLHSGTSKKNTNDKFAEVILPSKKVGPFFFQKGVIDAIIKSHYDVIIFNFDLRWIYSVLFLFFAKKNNTKFVLWGAWLTDSKIANKIRLFFLKKSQSSLFYTHRSRLDFVLLGLDKKKTFVANNTFHVKNRLELFKAKNKFRLLNVGSLNFRKRNDLLIIAFANIIDKIPEKIQLTFIGDGFEKKKLVNLVNKYKLEQRVQFIDKIEDSKILSYYYSEALCSLSFGQAGLTILQSFGFGIPYLTKNNAISGGELYNIVDGYNGYLSNDCIESFQNKIILLCNNESLSKELGQNAYNYYSEYCTIENMYQGFVDAIENTNLSKIDERL